MALFNEIQVGRFNRFAQKLLSMKGTPVVPTLSSDHVMTFTHLQGPEDWWLQGHNLYGAGISVTGLAANASRLELRNPATSNVVATIIRAVLSNAAAADIYSMIYFQNATTDQPTILVMNSFDRRVKTQVSSLILSDNAGAALVAPGGTQANVELVNAAINTPWPFLGNGHPGLPLLPGDALVLQNTNAAQQCNFTLTWRERPLEDSERQ